MKKLFACTFACFLALAAHSPALAQERSYFYERIDVRIRVNTDSTLEVEERQVFRFNGEYHMAFRYIPLQGLNSVSEVEVLDGQTGAPLAYSGKRLEKSDPASWGKFTTYRENGKQYIEWYYNKADTSYPWMLKYKVLGNVEFLQDGERVYWNVFSGYDVPVSGAQAEIILPSGIRTNSVALNAYRSTSAQISQSMVPPSGLLFSGDNFKPGEAFTVDVVLPKGTVSKADYFTLFFKAYFGYLGGIASVVLALLAGFLIWLFREKLAKGRGTVVPQYEPPQNLKPAMAEVILTEGLSNRGLTATLIDLAVRGYVKIEEDARPGFFSALSRAVGFGKGMVIKAVRLGIIALVLVVVAISYLSGEWSLMASLVPIVFIAAIMGLVVYAINKQTDYVITLQKDKNDASLEDYEKEYLGILLKEENSFSTRTMRTASNKQKQQLFLLLQKLKDSIYRETSTDTKAFYVDPYQGRKAAWAWTVILIILVIGGLMHGMTNFPVTQGEILLIGLVLSATGLWIYITYETRLNEQGRILKEDWLGFKMFLETAERYRLQNLTPEMFQKFLPYAKVFGIEKKWARGFEQMHVEQPNWYAGSHAAMVSSGGSFGPSSAGGFSPTAFSTSFSSAFTSAFASAGASGSSGGGGGGSAGGGGGGGGGGAG